MSLTKIIPLFLLLACIVSLNSGADWPRFRGPDGSAVAEATGLPTTWDKDTNVVWKTELPGAGTSSPIVIGDKIILTANTGYGVDQDVDEEQAQLRYQVLCFNRTDGKPVWKSTIKPDAEDHSFSGFHKLHGYASSTPAADEETVYAFFGPTGVVAVSLKDGTKKWQTSVGTGTHGWGSATSVVLYKDIVIVNASIESKKLIGLSKADGKKLWEVDGIDMSWSTPIVATSKEGRDEVVISFKNTLKAVDPLTGKVLWTADGLRDYICPTPVANDGILYTTGARANNTVALKLGGSGDVGDSQELWRIRKGSNVPSVVYHDGYLYWANEKRGVYCVDAKTGDIKYTEMLEPRPKLIYASPVIADGKIYYTDREKGVYVLATGPEFKLISHNAPMDDTMHNASPAVVDNRIIMRTDKALYCIGKK